MTPSMSFPLLAGELRSACAHMPRADARFCLFGSSVMYLHGLRESVGDVDLFVTRPLWEVLHERGWQYQRPRFFDPPILEFQDSNPTNLSVDPVPAHAFYDWRPRGMLIDVEQLLYEPQMVKGWPCMSLQLLATWKATIAHHGTRPNDWHDVEKIARYLRNGS